MKEAEMLIIGEIISIVLKNPHDAEAKAKAIALVEELSQRFPLYAD